MGKVFYWIKFSEKFYEDKGVKKLILKGGEKAYFYLYIYQRMLLLSASTEGYLYYEGYEECFADEIALVLELDFNFVRIAVMLMLECRLLEQCDESVFFMPQLQKMVGSETDEAARKREYRKKLAKKRDIVPCSWDNVLSSRDNFQECPTEIDIEKESEKETELHTEIDKDYGEIYTGECGNVILIDWQWKKLKEAFPDDYRERVDRLSRYIAKTGKHYPSHYATIIRWAEEDKTRGTKAAKAEREQESKGSFDTDSFFEAAVQRTYQGIK